MVPLPFLPVTPTLDGFDSCSTICGHLVHLERAKVGDEEMNQRWIDRSKNLTKDYRPARQFNSPP